MPDGVAPDVRDGLTPVARRALVELAALRMQTASFVQSTRTVDAVLSGGRVDGGRRAIYGELVRMARDWEVRHPLVEGQGNLGSLDGDGAVSADYTEMRLGPLGAELLRDVGDDVLDAAPDAPGPDVAGVGPARFPNLLVNGSFSLETGAASCIPPHNLREVVDAVIAFIDEPGLDTAGLLRHIQGPDFPTGGLVGGAELHDAYDTGRGPVVVRARVHVETPRAGRRLAALVVTELPFGVHKGGRGGVIAEIRRARGKRLRGVYEVHDESSEASGLRIVIDLDSEADPAAVLQALYAHTALQRTYQLHLVAAVGGQARTIGLAELIGHYVEHRRDVVARRTGPRADKRVLDIVRRDLLDIAASHGDERRTEIR
jgi:DNA gyrase subunit A